MIKLLSKETIDKIAAGEVVDRPENVVKELLDNAIDSGASAISVEIRGGGTELIRVTDNGCGIEKADLSAAFVRHATSKLTVAEDLNHITTMGFRGEALASIAGVSKVELLTKRGEDLTGSRFLIEGGKEISCKEIGIPSGTTILVRDLFFNVPVRRQFLKSAKTEASYVRDIVEKAAMACPNLSFSFLAEGKQIFHTSGNNRLKDVIYTIYGGETTSHLIPLNISDPHGTVTGFISSPALSRSRRDSEIYFVNGRFVKSSVIDRAIETAYESYLMQHRFPFTVLQIRIAPENLDVNIHPKKTEIRFSDDEAVFELVYQAIKNTLRHREHIEDVLKKEETEKKDPQLHLEPFEAKEILPSHEPATGLQLLRENLSDTYRSSSPSVSASEAPLTKALQAAFSRSEAAKPETGTVSRKLSGSSETAAAEMVVPVIRNSEKKEVPDAGEQLRFLAPESPRYYRFIGQLFETYWLIEYKDALYIIDQHAAHEKVNFERLMKQITEGEVYSQNILPVLLTLPAREAALLEDHLDEFRAFGFEIESAGEHDFYVRSVPASLPELSEKELLTEMIDGLSEIRTGTGPKLLREKIASMSCKAAVKGNRRLSEPEMRALVGELLNCTDPYNCPHGRPVMVKFSKYELDKMFRRIV